MEVLTLIVNVILTLLLPVGAGVVVWLSRILAQSLPDHQAPRLEQFARMAVRAVELNYQNNPSKKALAVAALMDLFRAFKLPLPEQVALETAIDAAVYELHTSKDEQ